MVFTRDSGILLHITSLPGKFGSGDLGKSAYDFVDWLELAGQNYWQVLPLVNIDKNNSPYTSTSAFAGNILLIDLENLLHKKYLTPKDLALPKDNKFNDHKINYREVRQWRIKKLKKAAINFFKINNKNETSKFNNFCKAQSFWLEDYALFSSLEDYYKKDWVYWPKGYASRNPRNIKIAINKFYQSIQFYKFYQWCFFEQWQKLYHYAASKNIKIIGDMPIYVSMNSADVWANKKLFKLDKNYQPSVVAGVPPDYFSVEGQRWGNPVYDWDENENHDFSWWISRLKKSFSFFDIIRLDHFLGFTRYWEIPLVEKNAINGKWGCGPKERLFRRIKDQLFPDIEIMPFIAEDLGASNPESNELRKKFKLPGMRVLQFAWDSDNENIHLPHNHSYDSITYTGTHDNNTIIGWYQQIEDWKRAYLHDYLQYFNVEQEKLHWRLIRACMESQAIIAIFPLQDILGLDHHSRMNTPGIPKGNWEWRFSWELITDDITSYLRNLTFQNGR